MNALIPRFVTAILAGGASRRMGSDKASLRPEGVGTPTLLERAARAAEEAGAAKVLVIGRERPTDWAGPEATIFRPDPENRRGEGPLAGIVTALEATEPDVPILMLSCDLPAITVAAITWLRSAADSAATRDGAALRASDGGPEPLAAVYAPSCLPALSQALSAGNRSLRRALAPLIAEGHFALLDAPPEVRSAFIGVNTPEELASVQNSQSSANNSYLLSLATAVLMRPRMYTMGGTFAESVAFLEGYFSGLAKTSPSLPPVVAWASFRSWLAEQQGGPNRRVFETIARSFEDDSARFAQAQTLLDQFLSLSDAGLAKQSDDRTVSG